MERTPGISWIELNGHSFSLTVDDTKHKYYNEIKAELGRLFAEMKEAGYVFHTEFVHMIWKKKKRRIIFVSTVRRWHLLWDLS